MLLQVSPQVKKRITKNVVPVPYLLLFGPILLLIRDVNVSIFFRSNDSIFFCTLDFFDFSVPHKKPFVYFFCSNEKRC